MTRAPVLFSLTLSTVTLITVRLLLHGFKDKDRIEAALNGYGCNMRSLTTALRERAIPKSIVE
jgi:uncharacterized protein (DUF433 family)